MPARLLLPLHYTVAHCRCRTNVSLVSQLCRLEHTAPNHETYVYDELHFPMKSKLFGFFTLCRQLAHSGMPKLILFSHFERVAEMVQKKLSIADGLDVWYLSPQQPSHLLRRRPCSAQAARARTPARIS